MTKTIKQLVALAKTQVANLYVHESLESPGVFRNNEDIVGSGELADTLSALDCAIAEASKPTETDGLLATELETEIWFRVEVSAKGENEWCANFETDWCVHFANRTFDSMIKAKSALDRHVANQDTDDVDYRIVRVTTKTEVIQYAKASV